jgi:hypothetical protein
MEGMLLALGIVAGTCGSLLIVINGLRSAPEAYEDEQGFHVVRNRAHSGGVSRRKKYAQQHGLGPLKPKQAHS